MLNKTNNEISPETLVECCNSTQFSLQTIQRKLKNADNSVWQRICQMALSDDFIWDFKTKLDWGWISPNLPLNENFNREFQDFIDWKDISQYQNLSEQFIGEFQNRVDWIWLSA